MICALLLGRERSSGFPGKNWHPLLGRPMMTYPLLAAKATPDIDRVYVSTDSPTITRIGAEHGSRADEYRDNEGRRADSANHGSTPGRRLL